ncbi:helix-turn-helix domain-containing protein [Zhouia sp. PK063]|uniref:helix-turn-helix domain-containing protein n=1 Tax=Zhouia sp. PK063 TaxID=3373602 RepID=UPI0037940897
MSTTATPHIGRKISRIRELRGMKQEALAQELGVSQQTISHLEQSATIDDEKLRQVAKALGVTTEAIENFSEDTVFNIIGNTYNDQSSSLNYDCTFNPLDKVVALYDEKEKLYERLLAAEKEKVVYLETLLGKK